MISISLIHKETEFVIERLKVRNFKEAESIVQELGELDKLRKQVLTNVEQNRAQINILSKQVGQEMAKGNKEAAAELKQQTQALKQNIAEGEEKQRELDRHVEQLALKLPNLPHETVPAGISAEDNTIIQTKEGKLPTCENPVPHWELAVTKNIINWELGVKITGSGFPVYMNKGAKLQRALIQFFLDQAEKAGYIEIMPPLLVNEASGYGTGQIPDKEGQMYHVTADDLFLIPTAEVPLTNLYRDVILTGSELPIKICGYTPCFRREAGSYGAHVRGLNRLHQFDKVEIVQIVKPETSYQVLEEMVLHVESILEKLELPYRRLLLCGGDMGFTSAKTYDLEVWSAAQQKWLEVSSVSNFETFQSNRLKLRYKETQDGKPIIAHTLNGSALALPRILACILENYQQADGSIIIPSALRPYTKFDSI